MNIFPYKQVLDKKDIKNILAYNNSDKKEILQEKEGKIYDIVKSVRKEQGLNNVKLNENKPTTFTNMVYNKPKENSEVSNFVDNSLKLFEIYKIAEKDAKGYLKDIGERSFETMGKITAGVGKTLIGVLDKLDEPLKKEIMKNMPIKGERTPLERVKAWNNNLLSSLDNISKDNFKVLDDIKNQLNTNQGITLSEIKEKILPKEEIQYQKNIKLEREKIEILFGTKYGYSDFFNFHSAEEKRRQMIASSENKNELQKFYEDTSGLQMMTDISTGLATGFGTYKALGRGAVELLQQAEKFRKLGNLNKASIFTKSSKILSGTEKAIDKYLINGIGILGAVAAINSAGYYAITGKYLFEGDKEATELMLASGVIGAVKGLTKIFTKGGDDISNKVVNDLLNDKEFVKGYKNTIKEINSELSDKAIPSRQEIYTKGIELKAIQDAERELGDISFKYDSLENKKSLIKYFIDNGYAKVDGVDNKGVKISFTDEYGSIIYGKKYNPKRPIINHLPEGELDIEKGISVNNLKEEILVKQMKDNTINKLSKAPKKEGFFERGAKDAGLKWDDNNKISSIYNYITDRFSLKLTGNVNRIYGRLTGDTRVGWDFKAANKSNEISLSMKETFGKAQSQIDTLVDVAKKVGEGNKNDFNFYLQMKSRLQKMENYKNTLLRKASEKEIELNKLFGKQELLNSKGIKDASLKQKISNLKSEIKKLKEGSLKTVAIFENGNKQEWTPDRIRLAIKEGDEVYSELASRVYNLNKNLLDLRVDAGTISREQADLFLKENPYYIPDRFDREIEDAFIKGAEINFIGISKGDKKLKGGSVQFEFSSNALENFASYLSYHTNVAMRVKLYNEMLKQGEKLGLARIVEPGKDLARRGYSIVDSFINGEKVRIEIPTFYKEAITNQNPKELGLTARLIGTATNALKEQATGRFNVKFQLISPLWEVPTAIMKNWSNGGKLSDYLGVLFRKGRLDKTPEGQIAMKKLMDDLGVSNTYFRAISKEYKHFIDAAYKEGFTSTIADATKVALDVAGKPGHNIELYTTRMPLFQAQLKKMGMTSKKFNELALSSLENGDINTGKLKRLLIAEGVDLDFAGYISKNLYDYNSASTKVNWYSNFFPYLNRSVNNVVAIRDLFENSPAKFTAYFMGAILASEAMYEYNYRENQRELMHKQHPSVRTKVGLVDVDEETGKVQVLELGRNISILEWMYPMIVALHNNGGVGDAINKMVKDITYFGDLDKPLLMDFSRMPPGVKQAIEVSINYDLFFDRQLIPDYARKADKTEEYNKYTNPLYIKLSKAIAIVSGGKYNEEGIMEGGTQISPIELEKMISTLDPLGAIGDLAALTINSISDIGVNETNVKFLNHIIKKTYQLQTTDVYKKEEAEYKVNSFSNIHKDRIRGELDGVKTIDELVEKGRDIVSKYKEYPDYESDYKKIIKNEIDKKEQIILYGKEYYNNTQKSADEYALYLANLIREKGIEAAQKDVAILKERGTFSKSKLDDIGRRLDKYIIEFNVDITK